MRFCSFNTVVFRVFLLFCISAACPSRLFAKFYGTMGNEMRRTRKFGSRTGGFKKKWGRTSLLVYHHVDDFAGIENARTAMSGLESFHQLNETGATVKVAKRAPLAPALPLGVIFVSTNAAAVHPVVVVRIMHGTGWACSDLASVRSSSRQSLRHQDYALTPSFSGDLRIAGVLAPLRTLTLFTAWPQEMPTDATTCHDWRSFATSNSWFCVRVIPPSGPSVCFTGRLPFTSLDGGQYIFLLWGVAHTIALSDCRLMLTGFSLRKGSSGSGEVVGDTRACTVLAAVLSVPSPLFSQVILAVNTSASLPGGPVPPYITTAFTRSHCTSFRAAMTACCPSMARACVLVERQPWRSFSSWPGSSSHLEARQGRPQGAHGF